MTRDQQHPVRPRLPPPHPRTHLSRVRDARGPGVWVGLCPRPLIFDVGTADGVGVASAADGAGVGVGVVAGLTPVGPPAGVGSAVRPAACGRGSAERRVPDGSGVARAPRTSPAADSGQPGTDAGPTPVKPATRASTATVTRSPPIDPANAMTRRRRPVRSTNTGSPPRRFSPTITALSGSRSAPVGADTGGVGPGPAGCRAGTKWGEAICAGRESGRTSPCPSDRRFRFRSRSLTGSVPPFPLPGWDVVAEALGVGVTGDPGSASCRVQNPAIAFSPPARSARARREAAAIDLPRGLLPGRPARHGTGPRRGRVRPGAARAGGRRRRTG